MLETQVFFDVLSDETRRRLLALILGEGELCVCELSFALDLVQPKVSRHLAVMREAEVLAMRKEGTWVYYRLHPQLPLWAARVLELMAQGMGGGQADQDRQRLAGMPDRPLKCCA
jgi:ArsR family transcriptional regulator